jgi:hypothetical protein
MLQSLYAGLAIVLLSITTLYINKAFYLNNKVMEDSKIAVLATSITNSIIEDASGSRFDEVATGGGRISLTSALTPKANLGRDAGELINQTKTFDDFDDFNNLDSTYSINIGGTLKTVTFRTQVKVEYVSDTNPNSVQNSPTWHKRLTVSVTSPSITDTIRARYVMSYWFFR